MLFQLIDAGVFCWRPRAYGSALLLLVVKQSRGMLCLKALAFESSAGQGKELQPFNDMPHPWRTVDLCGCLSNRPQDILAYEGGATLTVEGQELGPGDLKILRDFQPPAGTKPGTCFLPTLLGWLHG